MQLRHTQLPRLPGMPGVLFLGLAPSELPLCQSDLVSRVGVEALESVSLPAQLDLRLGGRFQMGSTY